MPKSKISGARLQQFQKQDFVIAPPLNPEVQEDLEIEVIQSDKELEEDRYTFFGYENYNLFVFSPESKIRAVVTKCISSKIFEYFMVIVIIMNTLTLAMYDYSDRQSLSKWNQVIDDLNFAISGLFIFEAIIRIVAHGLILHQGSYLRNGWNLIDATVVVAGVIEMAHGTLNLKSLRIIRIFRPLKTINTIKSMKSLIQALIMSIPAFANVVLFLMFVFMLFAIIGLHQYNGIFYNACRLSPEPESKQSWIADISDGRVCSTSDFGSYTCPVGQYCRNPSDNMTYSYHYEVMNERSYVTYGITNFDNIGRSLLTIFQIVTSDTWYIYMCNLMDADIPFFGALYSVLLVVIGQFFLMNLILAVIIFAFIKSQKENLTAELQQYQQKEEVVPQSSEDFHNGGNSKTKKSFLDIFKKKAKIGVKSPMPVKMKRKSPGQRRGGISVKNNSRPKLQINKLKDICTPMNQIQKEILINEQMPTKVSNSRQIKRSISMKASTQIEKSPVEKNANDEDNVTLNAFLKQKAIKRRIANLFKNQQANKNNQDNEQICEINEENNSNSLFPPLNPKCKDSSKTVNPYYFHYPEKIFLEDNNSKSSLNKNEIKQFDYSQNEELPNFKIEGINMQNNDKNDIKNIIEDIRLQNKQIMPIIKQSNKSWISVSLVEEGNQQVNKQASQTVKSQDRYSNQNFNFSSALAIKTKKSQHDKKQIYLSSGGDKTPNSRTPKNLLKKIQNIRLKKQENFKRSLSKASSTGVVSTQNSNKEIIIDMNIDKEYEKYFKTILKEATEDINEQGQQQSGMREIVGIKLSLEYLNEQRLQRQQIAELKQHIIDRKKISKIYKLALSIQDSLIFQLLMVFLIVMNTVVLSFDKYPVNVDQEYKLEVFNYYFTGVFTIELILKLLAVGFKMFFKGQYFNIFDTLIVIGSLVDILISQLIMKEETNNNSKIGSVITALRAFRLLRIFKLAKTWKRFELLLETMVSTLKDIASFSVLLFLFIFIFTLLGMELFAYKVKFNRETDQVDLVDGESPDVNFDNFINAFSLVFIVLTNDGTSEIYYNLYRSVSSIASTIYIVLLTMIGQKVMLNLFVAILLQNFDEGALKQKMHQYEQTQQQRGLLQEIKHAILNLRLKLSDLRAKISNIPVLKYFIINCCCKLKNDLQIERKNMRDQKEEALNLGLKKNEKHRHKLNERIKGGGHDSNSFNYTFDIDNIGVDGNPISVIVKESKIKRFTSFILRHPYYDYFIIFVIFVNTITLALDNPFVEPNSNYGKVLYYLDIVTTVVFIIEAILKIMTYGFLFNGEASYLKQYWNRWDFFIVIFSVLSLTVLSDDFKAFKVLRIFRLVSRNEGLKVAVKSIVLGLPNILNVTIIMFLFFLIFGVISVSQFKGKFYFCDGKYSKDIEIISKWDCLGAGGEWINQIYNFDNIPNAMVTLFVMSTTAGWTGVMLSSITSTDIDYVASSERNIFWNLFYIFFLIIGFFFFLNLFIGVVVTNFNTEKDKIGGNDLLTEKQREWIDLKLLVLRCAPIKKLQPPENKFRLFFFKIQVSKQFSSIILVSIVLNTLVLMVKWYQQPTIVDWSLEIANDVFTGIFVIEVIISLIGQGVPVYFREGWNIFNFIVALISMISILISALSTVKLKGVITLLRSFRILRIIRLLKNGGRSLFMIFNTFVITLQQLVNVGALLCLFIYMYAVVGMILFGQIMRNGLMNHQINFENFVNAFLTLFTVTTADSWNAILTSFIVEPSPQTQCVWDFKYSDYINLNSTTGGCGSKSVSYAYFLSFYFIVCLVFLQLFIAVILQGYDQTQIQEARLFNDKMTQQFRQVWANFDPEATTFIKLHQIRGFLWQLGAPLGFDESFKGKRFLQDKFIASLDLPTYYDFSKYQFLDVLDALSFRVMIIDHHKQVEEEFQKNEEKLKVDQENNEIKMAQLQLTGVNVVPNTELNQQVSELQNIQSLMVLKVKDEISKEINKLLFHKDNSNISALQDVINKEMRQRRHKEHEGQSLQDHEGLTSVHHMGAEAAIRKWKRQIAKSRRERQQIQINPLTKSNKIGQNQLAVEQRRFRINQSQMPVQLVNNSLVMNNNLEDEELKDFSLENTMNMTTRHLLIAHDKFINNKFRHQQEMTQNQSDESLRVEDSSSMDEKGIRGTKIQFYKKQSSAEISLEQLNEVSQEESSISNT